ncbi:MAG: VWA domain-containing protein, partial [Chloroflexi bacterium]|nr:VWA domain-containing protein [Chloroflexota bacterium]
MFTMRETSGVYKSAGWTLVFIVLSILLLAGCGASEKSATQGDGDATAVSQAQDAATPTADAKQADIATPTPEPSPTLQPEPTATPDDGDATVASGGPDDATPTADAEQEASASPTPEPSPTFQPEPTATPETEAPADEPETGDESAMTPTPAATAIPPNFNTAFILDASGSMLAALDNRTRLAVAQDAIGNLSAGLPSTINASLWVYGHRVAKTDLARSCQDIEEVIGLGAIDPDQFDAVAHGFSAKGYTPITDALTQAAASLPTGPNQRNSIVLVSDGEETCGGDPCALAAELAGSDASLVIHTIGLAVDDVTRAQLQCIADATG